MDEEVRIGFQTNYFLPNSTTPGNEQEDENEEERRMSRKLETIAYYILMTVLLIVIGFYVFFIATILVDKYASSYKFLHFEFPHSKDVDKNRALYKADYLTICNLDDKDFDFFLYKDKPKNKTNNFKLVSIEPSNDSELSCVTAVKFRGKRSMDLFDRFKFNIENDDNKYYYDKKIKLLNSKKNKINKKRKERKDRKERKQQDDSSEQLALDRLITSKLSLFTHDYRDTFNFDKILFNSIILEYNSTSKIVLKSFDEKTINLGIKNINNENIIGDINVNTVNNNYSSSFLYSDSNNFYYNNNNSNK